MKAPTYKQSGSAGTFTTATSSSVSAPAAVSENEIGYLRVLISSANVTITWPAGWTEVDQTTQGADFTAGLAWRRFVDSDDSASYTINYSASCTGTARIACYQDAKLSGTPHEGYTRNKGTSTSNTSSAIVTKGPNRLGVVVYTQDSTGTSSTPSGWTNDSTGSASGTRTYVDSKAIDAAGTESAVSRTITSEDWITFSLAIIPEARVFIT